MKCCIEILLLADIADAADQYKKSLLTADADCQYDSLIEINLDTVRSRF